MYYFLAFLAMLILAGIPRRIDVSEYEIISGKVTKPVTFCVLSDLHCRRFGKGQKKIMDIVDAKKPDCILIPGDLFDYERDFEISFELVDKLKGYPAFFTSGNHDIYLKEIGELRRRLEEEGITVLEDRSLVFGDCEITGMTDRGYKKPLPQLDQDHSKFCILLSHRPERIRQYNETDYDLIISGHAHGGQWCIPFTKQGIFTPHQGFFPKLTQGMHELKNGKLFISRGLASGNPRLPRLYNNPEITFITVTPKQIENQY